MMLVEQTPRFINPYLGGTLSKNTVKPISREGQA